ncbi:MAG: hypothetical protein J6Y93_02210 [Treponema sp.]|nr:hypothetical protein [Treponema sp.]
MNILIKTRRIVHVALTVALMALSSQIFAQSQDEISRVYTEIDSAFASKSADSLSKILKANSGSVYYTYYESYTLKKTRQLIIEDDLELARQVSLIVIDNNIENFDAVDLYSYIDKAILNEMAYKQAQENRRRLEAERLAAAQQRAREKIENRGTYQTVNTKSGSSVYVSEEKLSFSSVDWTVELGLANFMFQKVTDPAEYTSLKYGLALGLDLFYSTEHYVMGIDADVDMHLITMGQGEQEFMTSFRAVPELAFSGLSKNFFLRFGFGAYPLASDYKDVTGSTETFMTPIVGIGFDNIALGEGKIGLHADYYPGHFAYDGLKAAMEFGAQIFVPMAVNDKTKIGLELGFSDVLFMKEEGFDNRAKGIFGIGVGNVTK